MDKVFLGSRVSNLDTGDPAVRVSRVNLAVDSEHVYTAGDGSGRTVEAVCPWGTQAMADSILASLRDVEYRPYSGLDGLLDPRFCNGRIERPCRIKSCAAARCGRCTIYGL